MKRSAAMIVRPNRAARQFEQLVRKGVSVDLVPRIMARRADLFSNDRNVRSLIANRLGWVDVATSMKRHVASIEQFRNEVIRDGIRHVVLMGMGGSSLCPEVMKVIFGRRTVLTSLDVLDSTDPVAVKGIAAKVDLRKSLLIVASKSGGTIETRSHEAFFIEQCRNQGVSQFGDHFAAITDMGSELEKFARRHHYRKVFVNPSDVGGRYSALSYFGLVPAAFTTVDLRLFVDQAAMLEDLIRDRHDESNAALQLGALLAASQKMGIDKLTFLASRRLAPLVPWIEQLIAESTGKRSRGIVPIDAEPPGPAKSYGNDRLFVSLSLAGEKRLGRQARPSRIGPPCAEIVLDSNLEIAQQFLLWEGATAVAGYFAKVNPFDEPNVTESKDNTKRILAVHGSTGHFPFEKPATQWGRLSVLTARGSRSGRSLKVVDSRRFLRAFFKSARTPQYVALLGYFKSDNRTESEFARLRVLIREKTGIATLRGYGPRYLHSIGQLYKGGPQRGLFVMFVRRRYSKLAIPGQPFGFGELIAAQGMGDAQALLSRRRPAILIAFDGHPSSGIEHFRDILQDALK